MPNIKKVIWIGGEERGSRGMTFPITWLRFIEQGDKQLKSIMIEETHDGKLIVTPVMENKKKSLREKLSDKIKS